MKSKLAIFDLDGTLFDTGDVNYYSYREALQPYQVQIDREYFIEYCNGRHYTEFLPQIMEDLENMESVHTVKKELYCKHISKARANIHLFRMIENMRAEYYTAVVTTASRKNTMQILSHFGYDRYFDLIITQEDVSKRKPDPEGFLMAMREFAIGPEDTMIFEDSSVGVQSARATGATVFVVDRF